MANITVITCPQCGEIDQGVGHNPMTIQYQCFICNNHFSDEWCSVVDGTCPFCNAGDNEAISWKEHNPKISILDSLYVLKEFQFESTFQQLWERDFFNKVIEDMFAGKSVIGHFTRQEKQLFYEMYTGKLETFIMDEYLDIKENTWITTTSKDSHPQPDWEHPIPKKGPETPPSDDKRTKLRAKRKKR